MPTEAKRIDGLHEIAPRFDGMLIDQFGVIHDGQTLYPGTAQVLTELHRIGMPVAVMTNSGKRAESNRQRLVKMGVPRDHRPCDHQLGGLSQDDAGRTSRGRVRVLDPHDPQHGG